MYSLGKAIYLTARFQATGSKNKREFAQLQSALFWGKVRG